MRLGSLVVARTGSTRLPGKVMRVVEGRPLIEHLVERVRLARRPAEIVLCTSTLPEDDVLAAAAARVGIAGFRGSPNDVLERCLRAAEAHRLDGFAIVEGDEVFCDAEYLDRVLDRLVETGADYVRVEGLPLGAYVEGIRTSGLRRVCEMKDGSGSDGWPRYFTETGLFRVETLRIEEFGPLAAECRMTLDYPEDLAVVETIYARLHVPGRIFSLREVMALHGREPELRRTNAHLIVVYAAAAQKFEPLRFKRARLAGEAV